MVYLIHMVLYYVLESYSMRTLALQKLQEIINEILVIDEFKFKLVMKRLGLLLETLYARAEDGQKVITKQKKLHDFF